MFLITIGGIFIAILIFMIIASFLYDCFAIISCHIKDFCEYMGVSASITPVIIVLLGWVLLFTFPHIWWVGALCIALPVFAWFGTAGVNIWKVVLVKILGFPIFAALVLFSLISGHQKTKRKKNWDGTETTYTMLFPAEINTGEWKLKSVYSLGGVEFYENYDGTRCLVDHKQTLSFRDVQYKITPLYNINNPKPLWIRWLY